MFEITQYEYSETIKQWLPTKRENTLNTNFKQVKSNAIDRYLGSKFELDETLGEYNWVYKQDEYIHGAFFYYLINIAVYGEKIERMFSITKVK